MLKISKPLKHKITSRQLAPKVYDISKYLLFER